MPSAFAQSLPGREKDLGGGFTVRRLLPHAARRSVGPFVFFHHFGPVAEHPADRHDVRPHPHIGLATVTYLFEGAMMHRDSLGNAQRIAPGAINWMSAGRGIAHSERKPEDLKDREFVNHGLQLWVGLPQADEESEPSFAHTAAADLPQLSVDGAAVRVLVGEAFGARSPVKASSPTLYLDVRIAAGARFALPRDLAAEMAVYVVAGDASVEGESLGERALSVVDPSGAPLRIEANGREVRLVVIGGEPLDGPPRFMWWNFVSSRSDRISQAADDWRAGRFERVPDDDRESIPLPDIPLPR